MRGEGATAVAEAPEWAAERYVPKDARPQLRHTEFEHVVEMGGRVQYWRHRNGNHGGEWRHGLPKGVRSDDLRADGEAAAAAEPQAAAPANDGRPPGPSGRPPDGHHADAAFGHSPPAGQVPLPLLAPGDPTPGSASRIQQALFGYLLRTEPPKVWSRRRSKSGRAGAPTFQPWHGIPPLLVTDQHGRRCRAGALRGAQRVAAGHAAVVRRRMMLVPPARAFQQA